jgi:hypothetical protein
MKSKEGNGADLNPKSSYITGNHAGTPPIISIYTILLNKKVAPFAPFPNLLYIGTTRRTLDDDSIKGEEGNFSNTLAPFAL